MPLLPLNLCGEQAVQLAFLEHYSKCVVRKNLFIPRNDPGGRYHYSRNVRVVGT